MFKPIEERSHGELLEQQTRTLPREEPESAVARASPYSLAGLFRDGHLGPDDENAIAEIVSLTGSFQAIVRPPKGWMTPRLSGSPPESIPRVLSRGRTWRRYKAWRRRWSGLYLPKRPDRPWGLTYAGVAVSLLVDDVTVEGIAGQTNQTPSQVAALFIAIIRDYTAHRA